MARKKKLPKAPPKPKKPLVLQWHDRGWLAEIVENEDGGGWALSMTRDGDDTPVLIVPWVMGRNKVDPKPLNADDFKTQVKAAEDFVRRFQQQQRAAHRRSYRVQDPDGRDVVVAYDVELGDYEPRGVLTATDALGMLLSRQDLPVGFQLSRTTARTWAAQGFPDLVED